jgi:hypothetical protein
VVAAPKDAAKDAAPASADRQKEPALENAK